MDVSNSERHKFTLIVGGWPKHTAKKVIVDQCHQALREMGVASLSDRPAFCTGARRSMCLMEFKVRAPQEDYQGMRDRMQRILSTLNSKSYLLASGRKMWGAFSKTRPERDRGAHGALVRRTVRSLAADREEELEVEYGTGSAWLGDFKLASAVVEPDSGSQDVYVRFDALHPGGPLPWINATAVSQCLRVTTDEVKKKIEEQKRN